MNYLVGSNNVEILYIVYRAKLGQTARLCNRSWDYLASDLCWPWNLFRGNIACKPRITENRNIKKTYAKLSFFELYLFSDISQVLAKLLSRLFIKRQSKREYERKLQNAHVTIVVPNDVHTIPFPMLNMCVYTIHKCQSD